MKKLAALLLICVGLLAYGLGIGDALDKQDKRKLPIPPQHQASSQRIEEQEVAKQSAFVDFLTERHATESGMFVVFLDDDKFQTSSEVTSPTKARLCLGRVSPLLHEWRSLFFDTLHADAGGTDPGIDPIEFVQPINGFPMLSRLESLIGDAKYSSKEVGELKSECVRLLPSTTGDSSLALRKLIAVADQATANNLGITFEGE